MSVELLPNTAAGRGSSGGSSWYYSSAPPAQSVSALPKPDDLRARKAKVAALAISTATSSAITTDIDTPIALTASSTSTLPQLSSLAAGAMGMHGPAASYKLDPQTARHIAELEKVNWRDTHIKLDSTTVPDISITATTSAASSTDKGKPKLAKPKPKSPNVRRILASAKTFHNHLSDDIASQELHLQNSSAHKHAHTDPAATPLGYVKCAAEPPAGTAERCRRTFCEICGYWGTIGCLRCGVRLCSAECGVTHREARCTRRF
ncbi:hypothetical protein TWF696_004232 [Orbilia brochopaga]|uniref:HIT-type domain-containing protein n=1 Tax=Orbilia brochopaga TaxID=3140254 RepID=A0AAV9V9C6_9PEZI